MPRSSGNAAAAVVCAPSGRRGWCGPDAPAAKARSPTRRAPSTPAVRPAAEVASRRAGGARKALHAARRGTAHARAVRREHAWRVPDLHGALAHVARGEMVRPLQQHVARAGVGQHRLGEQHRLGKRAYTLHRTPPPMRPCPVADSSPAVLRRLLTHTPCVSATTAAERAQLASRRLDRICEALRRHFARPPAQTRRLRARDVVRRNRDPRCRLACRCAHASAA